LKRPKERGGPSAQYSSCVYYEYKLIFVNAAPTRFIAQNRMKLSGEYKPVYRIVP
jgi:hypothetical protein